MNTPKKYLESRILTASKEELMLMLFDGALRFAGSAKERMAALDFEGSCGLLIRAQDILTELMSGLPREELGDRIYDNLMGLYQSIANRLMRANVKHDAPRIDEAVKLLSHIRETWAMSIEKDRKERLEMLAPAAVGNAEGDAPRAPLNLEG